MFMPQTLDEYLDNPMGKGATATNRNLIKSDLDARYDKLISRYKTFDYKYFYDGKSFYAHIQIPSESERTNKYDVVIQFEPTDKAVISDGNLKRYTLKVFSNCPSFTYTYAYVYNDYGLLIEFLKDKYKSIVLKDNPVVKNPGEIINFEKSIYFACKFIKSNTALMNKLYVAGISKPLNIPSFIKNIKPTDTVELEIKKENNRLQEEKKKALEKLTVSKPKRVLNKLTGTMKQRPDHKITPHSKIKGKPKTKSTIKK